MLKNWKVEKSLKVKQTELQSSVFLFYISVGEYIWFAYQHNDVSINVSYIGVIHQRSNNRKENVEMSNINKDIKI